MAGQHREKDAEQLYRQALAIVADVEGEEHPVAAELFSSLAAVAEAQGHIDDAELHLRQAITIATRTLGPDHEMTEAFVHDLATFYEAHGMPARAEPLREREALLREARERSP